MNFVKSAILSVAVLSATNAFADDNVLRVATEPSFAPFEFMDQKTSELVGFDVDIINAVAEVEGYKTGSISRWRMTSCVCSAASASTPSWSG